MLVCGQPTLAPAQGRCPRGDKNQGPCGSRSGGIVPPARKCHSLPRRAAGICGLKGQAAPIRPKCQQPAPAASAGGAPAAGSAKAAATTGPPGPRQTLIWSATCRTTHSP
jgi:hypothetical protein